jgi:hypothetical protein
MQQTLPKTISTVESCKFLKSFLTSLGCDLGFVDSVGISCPQDPTRSTSLPRGALK